MINSKLISLLPAGERQAVMYYVTLIYLSECHLLSISYDEDSPFAQADGNLLHMLLSESSSDVKTLHQASQLLGSLSKSSPLNLENLGVQVPQTVNSVLQMLPDVCKLSQDISDFWFRCQYVAQKNTIVQETMQWLLAHNSALVTLAHAKNPLE